MSRRTFTRITRVVAEMCRTRVRSSLKSFDFLSLTGDGVSLFKRRGFQLVTATGINKEWQRGTFVLGVERMTGSHTASRVAGYTLRLANEIRASLYIKNLGSELD